MFFGRKCFWMSFFFANLDESVPNPQRRHRENRGDGGVEISLCTGVPDQIVALDAAPGLYTVLYTIVPSSCEASALLLRMSLTAFAVESLSLRSDIRFRASCTDADDGVETDFHPGSVPGNVM